MGPPLSVVTRRFLSVGRSGLPDAHVLHEEGPSSPSAARALWVKKHRFGAGKDKSSNLYRCWPWAFGQTPFTRHVPPHPKKVQTRPNDPLKHLP